MLSKINEEKNQPDDSVGSLGSTVGSFVVSIFVVSSGITVGAGVGLGCSVLFEGGVGELFAGEFRCCSSSYSLIKRFFSG